mgnify:CR=1 FL=1
MSIEALWSAVFSDETGPHTAGGVLLLQNGHVHGGDNNYHYQGTYRLEGNRIRLHLTATHFHGGRNHVVGDRDTFGLNLAGTLADQVMELTGEVEDDAAKKVTASLQRAAEVPEPGPATV